MPRLQQYVRQLRPRNESYVNYVDKFTEFEYFHESTVKPYEYIKRGEKSTVKVCNPYDTNFDFIYKEKKIVFKLETLRKSTEDIQLMVQAAPGGHGSTEQIILKMITLFGENKQILIDFIDEAKEYCENQIKLSKKSNING